MDDSPLVSPMIKDYCTKYNVEEILNNTIQSVLTNLPSDPYSLMCSLLKEVMIIFSNQLYYINRIAHQFIELTH